MVRISKESHDEDKKTEFDKQKRESAKLDFSGSQASGESYATKACSGREAIADGTAWKGCGGSEDMYGGKGEARNTGRGRVQWTNGCASVLILRNIGVMLDGIHRWSDENAFILRESTELQGVRDAK